MKIPKYWGCQIPNTPVTVASRKKLTSQGLDGDMPETKKTTLPIAVYEIKVQGSLDKSWSDWYCGMMVIPDEAHIEKRVTTLRGPVVDQSALRGILTRLWDMNYELISVQRIPPLLDEEDRDA